MTVPSSGDEGGGGQSGGCGPPSGRIVLTENVNLNCCSGMPVPAPVPAPRTSLARRDILSEDPSDPVYVNNDQPTAPTTQTQFRQQAQQQILAGQVVSATNVAVGHTDVHLQTVRWFNGD